MRRQATVLLVLILGLGAPWGLRNVLATAEEENPLRKEEVSKQISIVENHKPEIRRDTDSESPAALSQPGSPASEGDAAAGRLKSAETVEAETSEISLDPADELAEELVQEIVEELSPKAAIQKQIADVRASESLDAELREKILANLESALESVRITEEQDKQHAGLQQQIQAIPQELARLKALLEEPSSPAEKPDIQSLTLQQIEAQYAEFSDALAKARETLKKNLDRGAELSDRRKQSQQQLTESEEKQAKLKEQLDAPSPEGTMEIADAARRSELETRLERLQSKALLLKTQLDLAKASVELQPLQHDLSRREVARLEAEESRWAEALSAKRDREAEMQIEEAKRIARETDPALLQLATENQELAETRSKYATAIDRVAQELRDVREAYAEEDEAFKKIESRVNSIGMTEAIGQLLRTHQRKLGSDRPLRSRAKEIEDELPKVVLLAAQSDEKRNAMWDFEHLVRQETKKLLARYDEQTAYDMVHELLSSRRQYLQDLSNDLHKYQIGLADLHEEVRKTAELTAAHRSYIGEHILWIRSADMVSWSDVVESQLALRELLSPSRWLQVVQDVGSYLQKNIVMWGLAILGLFLGLLASDRIKDRLRAVGTSKAVATGSRYFPTVEATLETAFLAGFLPGGLLLLSLYLTRFPDASLLEEAIGIGLRWTALMWLGLSVMQAVCRSEGLAEAHFGWHPRNVQVIRKNVRLLITLGLPAVFVVMIIESYRDGDYVSSLGRLAFMVGMSVMALFTHRLLDPYRSTNGLWANPNVLLYRVRSLVHASCVAIPVLLTCLAAAGYVYSAHQLAFRAQLSLWLIVGVVVSQALLGRYLQVARRNAAMRHMQHRRAEQAEQQEPDIPTETDIDFQSIGGQVRRLLRGATLVAIFVGVSFIWADMVPALKFLDRVELWQVESNDIGSEFRWVTLSDVLLAASAFLATVMAARNLPGLLNITIFERLPIDYGTRYALTAVSRYLISLIGVILAFQFIGVTWRSVQWLVAAMTVGLGFGLQEIFANFVSGLIIFTERPVRVGDMVTVGNVTGKVTRVQIRATTITDFDRRELVVPNKRFITEDVINWTLSDPITRVVLPVGISYDCDPEMARQQLLQVAKVHPLVLDEPEVTAVFIGFGESTLDLELRVFIVGRDNVFAVQNELNLAINRAFKQANLEIAYPQRDLRIRSVDAAAIPESWRPNRAA